MSVDRSIVCYDGQWQEMLAIAVDGILLWFVGIGSLFAWAIFTQVAHTKNHSHRCDGSSSSSSSVQIGIVGLIHPYKKCSTEPRFDVLGQWRHAARLDNDCAHTVPICDSLLHALEAHARQHH